MPTFTLRGRVSYVSDVIVEADSLDDAVAKTQQGQFTLAGGPYGGMQFLWQPLAPERRPPPPPQEYWVHYDCRCGQARAVRSDMYLADSGVTAVTKILFQHGLAELVTPETELSLERDYVQVTMDATGKAHFAPIKPSVAELDVLNLLVLFAQKTGRVVAMLEGARFYTQTSLADCECEWADFEARVEV